MNCFLAPLTHALRIVELTEGQLGLRAKLGDVSIQAVLPHIPGKMRPYRCLRFLTMSQELRFIYVLTLSHFPRC